MVVDCTIRGNYFGIFLSHAAGVTIEGNRILDSSVYGIDPYGYTHDVLIARNEVIGSGLHGIVLANHVTRIRVVANRIERARAHGIVLFAGSNANVVTGNDVRDVFDGVVITDSSRNSVTGNSIERVRRFALRISGRSDKNHIDANALTGALVGVYVYRGAAGNRLIGNSFAGNAENVRVRADATGNDVRPRPARSELP